MDITPNIDRMDVTYQEVKEFKFQANLLYVESILHKDKIDFQTEDNKLFVKAQDSERAHALIVHLDLDESDINEDSEGYVEGYNEWADKRYVNGYFTGGTIPRWMYSKTYARYYGPFIIISGVFYFVLMLNGADTNGRAEIQLGTLIPIAVNLGYVVCGVLLTIRGFKKEANR